VRHSEPLAVAQLRARREADAAYIEDSRTSLRRSSPAIERRPANPLSDTGYDETPDYTAGLLREFGEAGFLNIRRRLLRHDRRSTFARIPMPWLSCRPVRRPRSRRKLRLAGLGPATSATTPCS